MDSIKSGFVARNLIWGIILGLLAIAIIISQDFVQFPLEIRGFMIPGWSLYALSSFFFVIAILLIAGAGRGDRCADCNRTLVLDRYPFSMRDGDKIVHAVRELDTELISNLRRPKENEPTITLVLDYCPACRRVAKIEVKKEGKRGAQELVPGRVVTGAPVWKFIDVIEKVRSEQPEEGTN